jgi:hypothetical protein
MSKQPRSASSAPTVRTLRRQAVSDKLKNWNGAFDPELWRHAQAEQDAEELAKASPVPVVFPVFE